MTLVCPILKYGALCWDLYREGQIHTLDRVQKKAAKFAHHTNELNWETLSQSRKISRICALCKAYSGEQAWKAIVDRLQRPSYLKYGAVCWDLYREGQIHTLDRVQKKAAKFAHHTNELNWETLSQSRKILMHMCSSKAYSGERAWKAIVDRFQRPNYLSRVDHERKIRNRRQRMDIGKYSFVNRTIRLWNRLPAEI